MALVFKEENGKHVPFDTETQKHFFKHFYKDTWGLGKERQDRLAERISRPFKNNEIKIIEAGYGANSTEFISKPNLDKGDPDLDIYESGTGKIICSVEVTGGKRMSTYGNVMLREDKIDHAKKAKAEGKKTFYAHVYGLSLAEDRKTIVNDPEGVKYFCHDDDLAIMFRNNVHQIPIREYRFPFCLIPASACDGPEIIIDFIKSRLGKTD